MRFKVLLTEDAAQDLAEIYAYIVEHDAPDKAEYVIERIAAAMESLTVHPERGVIPKELLGLGIREYRQTFFKPYRLIYRIEGQRVYVYLVSDGRRDMQTLLTRRLLGS